ncbi:hypothetical protein RJ639_047180 [Escallonia herrerae]|uniref:DRBM domain-containing protein n=1 Tax=Escallonia herrerae TaxID=1293975 RepID=A0AA89AZU8_9ASTE|nr:hypothetical protein RJ639_047180 [Escallonia herrerae]
MGISSWLYTNSTKQKVVKIVHPGGHAELHDRPILAAEIIHRNPRCVVTHPNVFQQPWAIVEPDTTLMPGQKFYVVPITTIRKLQQLSLKYHPSRVRLSESSPSFKAGAECDAMVSTCCLFTNKNKPNRSSTCLGSSDKVVEITDRNDGKPLEENCFVNLVRGIKNKARSEDLSKESSYGSSETKALTSEGIKLMEMDMDMGESTEGAEPGGPSHTRIDKSRKKGASPDADAVYQTEPKRTHIAISEDTACARKMGAAKSRLHDICAANHWTAPMYECCNEEGPSHQKLFTFKVIVEIKEASTTVVCVGNPQVKKKTAAEDAAEGALWYLKQLGYN